MDYKTGKTKCEKCNKKAILGNRYCLKHFNELQKQNRSIWSIFRNTEKEPKVKQGDYKLIYDEGFWEGVAFGIFLSIICYVLFIMG